MKRYTTRDKSWGYVSREDTGLSLLEVSSMTDWSDEEFENISNLEIGQKLNYSGIEAERTE